MECGIGFIHVVFITIKKNNSKAQSTTKQNKKQEKPPALQHAYKKRQVQRNYIS